MRAMTRLEMEMLDRTGDRPAENLGWCTVCGAKSMVAVTGTGPEPIGLCNRHPVGDTRRPY